MFWSGGNLQRRVERKEWVFHDEKIFLFDKAELLGFSAGQGSSVFLLAIHADCTDADGGISGKYE